MLTITAKLFKARLDKEGCNYTVHEDRNGISAGWNLDGGASIRLLVSFDDDNKSCNITAYKFVNGPDAKWGKALIALNNLNENYRWVKFYIDSDNDIILQDDAVITIDTCADEVMELVNRMLSIAEEAYPSIMKAIA